MSHDNSRIHFLHQCTEPILRSLKAPMSPRTRLADCVSISGGGYSRMSHGQEQGSSSQADRRLNMPFCS